ncbi:MAG: tetratricopeptide repeat protein [Rikenellaceae bacterium]
MVQIQKNIALWLLTAMMLILSIGDVSAQYNKDYFLWMGRKHLIESEYREAITVLNSLIRSDNKAYEGYFLRGIAKYNMSDLIGADSDLSLALEHNPVYTIAYTYRAITRSRLGNYDDALKDFAKAIDLRPDLPDPYYSRGVTRLLNQQFEEAIEDFDLYIRQERRVSDAYVNRGICYLQLKDTTRAYENFDMAIRTNRNSPEGYNRRGNLLLSQEKYSKAEQDFNRAIQNDSTHLHSYFNRALVYNNQHRPNEALLDLDKIIELDPTNSLTYFNRAIILSQIGDYNKALDDYDQVAYLSPNNVLVYFYRANLLSRLGEIERAEGDYTRAIELYPDFANAYLYRSNIRFLLRNSKGAMADKAMADKKISEHKSKLQDSTYSIYADSTYRFDKLLSFDTNLSGSSFESVSGAGIGRQQEELKLISLYKFTFIKPDEDKPNHHQYYDAELMRFLNDMDNEYIAIDHRSTNIESEELSSLEDRYIDRTTSDLGETEWSNLFKLGITQNLIKQYTSSLESISNAIKSNPNNPFLYINRAAARAEMIEFISSIESSFQRISIDADPANRLNNATKRSYDYDEAIADIEIAIKLHPTLAYNYYNLGGLLVISGRLPEAYDAYNKAIELYSGFAQAYYNRGIVQIMMKDTRKGCIDLSKAGELGIDNAYQLLQRYSSRE